MFCPSGVFCSCEQVNRRQRIFVANVWIKNSCVVHHSCWVRFTPATGTLRVKVPKNVPCLKLENVFFSTISNLIFQHIPAPGVNCFHLSSIFFTFTKGCKLPNTGLTGLAMRSQAFLGCVSQLWVCADHHTSSQDQERIKWDEISCTCFLWTGLWSAVVGCSVKIW